MEIFHASRSKQEPICNKILAHSTPYWWNHLPWLSFVSKASRHRLGEMPCVLCPWESAAQQKPNRSQTVPPFESDTRVRCLSDEEHPSGWKERTLSGSGLDRNCLGHDGICQ
jgi:hypothetical protein